MGRITGSFRDPSGFLFERDGVLFRQVNTVYRPEYDHLSKSGGLFDELIREELLVPHEEVDVTPEEPATSYKILRPKRIPFISYPFEWTFSQLKDAALLTLRLQRIALDHACSLKDASAYNVQFDGSRPVFIDTLSFESYSEGAPWVAYRQFCKHFLAPLSLCALRDIRLSGLLQTAIDGIPLDLASLLLPAGSWARLGLLTHIHLHAKSEKKHSDTTSHSSDKARRAKLTKFRLLALIDNLESCVRRLRWKPGSTEWGDYYTDTNYTDQAFEAKKQIVERFVSAIHPFTIWDIGANTGVFTRVAIDAAKRSTPASPPFAVALDVDPLAAERDYLQCCKEQRRDMLPLVVDLTTPSPSIGWDNRERYSLTERGPADMCLALALIHHLSISNNLPFPDVARYLRRLCRSLVIEFVPKSDSQVQRLLRTRRDVFGDYTREAFEASFSELFRIDRVENVEGSERTLYLMTVKHPALQV